MGNTNPSRCFNVSNSILVTKLQPGHASAAASMSAGIVKPFSWCVAKSLSNFAAIVACESRGFVVLVGMMGSDTHDILVF